MKRALTGKKPVKRIGRSAFAVMLMIVSACSTPERDRIEYAPAAHDPIIVRPASGSYEQNSYVGSDSCRICHPGIYERWERTAHSRGLTEKDYANPPHQGNCSRCHLTSAVELRVGCEACHGPKSGHVKNPGLVEHTDCRRCDIHRMCIQCHIRSIDPEFEPRRGWVKTDHGKNK